MQDTLLKNELRNIEKNEANKKNGYSNNIANPDLQPPKPRNPREGIPGVYGNRPNNGIFGATGPIGFDSVNFGQTTRYDFGQEMGPLQGQIDRDYRKGQSSQTLPRPNMVITDPLGGKPSSI